MFKSGTYYKHPCYSIKEAVIQIGFYMNSSCMFTYPYFAYITHNRGFIESFSRAEATPTAYNSMAKWVLQAKKLGYDFFKRSTYAFEVVILPLPALKLAIQFCYIKPPDLKIIFFIFCLGRGTLHPSPKDF